MTDSTAVILAAIASTERASTIRYTVTLTIIALWGCINVVASMRRTSR